MTAYSSISLCLVDIECKVISFGSEDRPKYPQRSENSLIQNITHLAMQIHMMRCISTAANTNTHLHDAFPSLSTHTPPFKQKWGGQGSAARAPLCFGASGLISSSLIGFSSVMSLLGAAGGLTGTSVLIRWVKSNEMTIKCSG